MSYPYNGDIYEPSPAPDIRTIRLFALIGGGVLILGGMIQWLAGVFAKPAPITVAALLAQHPKNGWYAITDGRLDYSSALPMPSESGGADGYMVDIVSTAPSPAPTPVPNSRNSLGGMFSDTPQLVAIIYNPDLVKKIDAYTAAAGLNGNGGTGVSPSPAPVASPTPASVPTPNIDVPMNGAVVDIMGEMTGGMPMPTMGHAMPFVSNTWIALGVRPDNKGATPVVLGLVIILGFYIYQHLTKARWENVQSGYGQQW